VRRRSSAGVSAQRRVSGGGSAPDRKGKVELDDGGVYEQVVRGLCPYGEAIFFEANSV
jgi:hypothetical protein